MNIQKAKKIVPEGWFKWERPGIDFPFYNDDSVPAWHAWLLIGATLLVAVVMNVTTFLQVGGTAFKAFLVFLLPLAALLFVAHCIAAIINLVGLANYADSESFRPLPINGNAG